ncbi:ABC transporter ATP-binding protein [Acetobacterium sp. K1/6]|jgi:teichoic acid transport system ATP-binding protein|uniref:ABC transporter ATP-binding protein n=1 Tax=Acetobacterium sp. K1/6 TaxID=3055467 RepID=UPI002ACA72E3|nr:ABC transporter ATP-binding protein [Acetobacterium sp. K1/6]MDZ5724321.1 ABC transporter ATP-binding protein [Acetobacterium sp. K1/6]
MSDVAIKIEEVTKIYQLYKRPMDRLKESMSLIKKKEYHQKFYALNNINLEIKKGESIGIVGKNGSGKSTLLKIISGVLTQSKGEVYVDGKVSALLELGTGFNPEYTGIENIYANGLIMGYSQEEMDERLDDIVNFAQIGEYIYQPVKTYSSGMFARLAFATAINVDPEILIVDEVLAVGDAKFQIKCINKMEEFKASGKTVLFVSHTLEQIKRFCTKGVWIDQGEMRMFDDVTHVIDMYESEMLKEAMEQKALEEGNPMAEKMEIDAHLGKITAVSCNTETLTTFDDFSVEIEYELYDDVKSEPLVGVAFYTIDRQYIFGPNTHLDEVKIPKTKGIHRVRYVVPRLPLLGGKYEVDIGLFANKSIVNLDYETAAFVISVVADYFTEGLVHMEHQWEIIKD